MLNRICTLVLLTVFSLAGAACTAKTDVGKAIEATHLQQKIVFEVAVAVAVLNERKQIAAAQYEQAKVAYGQWADAQGAIAQSLATWAAVKSAPNEQQLSAALTRGRAVTDSYLKLINSVAPGLVDRVKKSLGGAEAIPGKTSRFILTGDTQNWRLA